MSQVSATSYRISRWCGRCTSIPIVRNAQQCHGVRWGDRGSPVGRDVAEAGTSLIVICTIHRQGTVAGERSAYRRRAMPAAMEAVAFRPLTGEPPVEGKPLVALLASPPQIQTASF